MEETRLFWNEERYRKISEPFRNGSLPGKLLKILNLVLTGVGYFSYPALLIILFRNGRERLFLHILLPAVGFVLLSAVRRKINHPRPYEVLKIQPLMVKDTKGASFPSRHVFSLCLIAACWYGIRVPVGILLSLGGLLLGCIRVIGGVHFPQDVLAGAVLGHLWGFLLLLL